VSRGPIHSIKQLLGFARPFAAYHLGARIRPVLAGYKITHRCNLNCLHCPYWRRSGAELNFSGVLGTLEKLLAMGVRILILEGGEPLLWRDGKRTIEDVVQAARSLFPSVCLTTNGTIPWGDLPLDRVWVSLDGPPEIHDRIRGKGVFARVMENIDGHRDGRTLVSTTFNRLNFQAVTEFFSILRGRVEGVTIQFHYPYGELPDPLFISPEERGPILDELMQLKAQGYPVANSFASLTEMKSEQWSCEDRLLANAEPDGSVFHGCYLKNRGRSICSICGFTAHNEMSLAFKGRWESILTGLRIFFEGN
jgi:MoaA/NifB/PqqE/SkfB family radical SAM enzyme